MTGARIHNIVRNLLKLNSGSLEIAQENVNAEKVLHCFVVIVVRGLPTAI